MDTALSQVLRAGEVSSLARETGTAMGAGRIESRGIKRVAAAGMETKQSCQKQKILRELRQTGPPRMGIQIDRKLTHSTC